MRFANTIKALSAIGEIDLFVAKRDLGSPQGTPEDATIRRLSVVDFPGAHRSAGQRLRWLVRPSLPLKVGGRDFSSVRRSLASFIRGEHYDLVWVSRIEAFVAAEPLLTAPTIVDIDDLNDLLNIRRLETPRNAGPRSSADLAASLVARHEARAWAGLQKKVAASVRAVCVCSESDRRHLDVPNARVVPNGYDRPDPPLGKVSVGDPPTILFPGRLSYRPNIDGASYLATQIGPLLRDRIPDAQVRLVGHAPESVLSKLSSPPEVIATGWVPRMEDELQRADVLAVPIRYGGGTRIKILEGFAHRIPVVSTSQGAYGLDVEDGRHLLIADTPDGFANACAELCLDEERRRALSDHAQSLFLERYEWSTIGRTIREMARQVADS